MVIGIDARFILGQRRGIGNYSLFLLQELVRLPTPHKFILYINGPENEEIRALVQPHVRICNLRAGNYLLWEQVLLPGRLRADGVTLYHGLGNTGPYFRPSRCRLLLTVHDVMFLKKELSKSTLYQRLGKVYRKFSLKWTADKIDKIITVSAFSRQDILQELPVAPEKVIAIHESYNGFFGEPSAANPPAGPPFFLALGARDARKNTLGLIEAFARIHTRTATNLRIVGYSGWQQSKAYGRVMELGLQERVQFSGFITDANLRTLYHQARAFAYVSVYEGFGIPVLEAMAAGCPVIGSATTSIPEIAGQAAVLVDPLNAQALGDALLRLDTDEALRNTLKAAGLRQAGRFSWQQTARETLRVYDTFS